MKITVELPEETVCGFINYVFRTDNGMSMGCRSIDTDALRKGISELVNKSAEENNDE
mgnify:CR=1 FL=1